jgi:hypothetical protein
MWAHERKGKNPSKKTHTTGEIGRTRPQHVNKNGVKSDTIDENGKRMMMTR